MGSIGTGSKRRHLWTLLLCGLAVLVVGLAAAQGSQPVNDPNQRLPNGEASAGSSLRDCVIHHRQPPDKMYDAFVVVPILPKQLKRDEEAEGVLQVVNTWRQHLRLVEAYAQPLGNETLISFPGGSSMSSTARRSAVEEFEFQGVYNYETGNPPNHIAAYPATPLNFTVGPGAKSVDVRLSVRFHDVAPNGTTYALQLDSDVYVPTRAIPIQLYPTEIGVHERAVERNRTFSGNETRFTGDWRLQLKFEDGRGVTGAYVDYSARVRVSYETATGGGTLVSIPVDTSLVIPPFQSTLLRVPMKGLVAGQQNVSFTVKGHIYYERGHDDRTTPDRDNYTRTNTRTLVVGTEFIASELQPVKAGAAGGHPALEGGELLGFASAALLVPSLLLGGTYGRTSRRFFNAVLGGAKRRVMFHNLLSLGLVFTALVHIALFAYELRYTILYGMLWGGLSAVGLLILGLTGYYQVPLIQKYGFNWWRFVHLSTGLLVVLLVGYHAVADGDHFDFLRDDFEWISRYNSARR